MKHKKKFAAAALASAMLFTVCFGLTGCNETNETGLKTVQLCEVTHSLFYAPQYVAMAEGFFEDEGLEISLTNGGGADKVMAAVLSDNMDVGLAGPESCIYVYKEGKADSPKVFAQLTKRDGSFLIAKDPVDNFEWNDLKGKTVIPGRKGGVPFMTFSYVLQKNGLTPGVDVTLDDSIQFDLMAGAFTSGQADYVTLFEPTASTIVQQGKGYYATSVGAQSGEIPYTAYFAKQSYMEKNPDVIQGITNAIARGQDWVTTHSAEEIAQVIAYQFPDTDMDSLVSGIQSYLDIDAWNQDPVMKEDSLAHLQEVIIQSGELEQAVPFEAIVDNQYAQKAALMT